jgi:hypothetical protein
MHRDDHGRSGAVLGQGRAQLQQPLHPQPRPA